jgi:RNA polymerase sigma-70 factor (ECF subfamily)
MNAAYTLACYLTRDTAQAEDIVQDAFLRAFRSFDGWRGESAKAWLLAIVRNCFRDTVSASLPAHLSVDGLDTATTDVPPALVDRRDPEHIASAQSEAAMLRRSIENLPEPFRETLVLRELEEMGYRDIAALTDVPIGTVMSRISRARQMLSDMLLPRSMEGGER